METYSIKVYENISSSHTSWCLILKMIFTCMVWHAEQQFLDIQRHIPVTCGVLFRLWFRSFLFLVYTKLLRDKIKAWLFNLLLCKLCCIIPKRSSDASLLHSPHSKDTLHSSQRSVQWIHLPRESFPDPVNRRPSLRWGRQLGPARFLVDSCDSAAHVSQ